MGSTQKTYPFPWIGLIIYIYTYIWKNSLPQSFFCKKIQYTRKYNLRSERSRLKTQKERVILHLYGNGVFLLFQTIKDDTSHSKIYLYTTNKLKWRSWHYCMAITLFPDLISSYIYICIQQKVYRSHEMSSSCSLPVHRSNCPSISRKFPFDNISIPRRTHEHRIMWVPTAVSYSRAMVLQHRNLGPGYLRRFTIETKASL